MIRLSRFDGSIVYFPQHFVYFCYPVCLTAYRLDKNFYSPPVSDGGLFHSWVKHLLEPVEHLYPLASRLPDP